jgi:hypothetical protein
MKKLTTSEVAACFGVAQVTVNVWCLQGKFPNAEREETPRGPVWTIPESDLSGFEKPKAGRPLKSKTSGTDGKVTVKPSKKKGSKG